MSTFFPAFFNDEEDPHDVEHHIKDHGEGDDNEEEQTTPTPVGPTNTIQIVDYVDPPVNDMLLHELFLDYNGCRQKKKNNDQPKQEESSSWWWLQLEEQDLDDNHEELELEKVDPRLKWNKNFIKEEFELLLLDDHAQQESSKMHLLSFAPDTSNTSITTTTATSSTATRTNSNNSDFTCYNNAAGLLPAATRNNMMTEHPKIGCASRSQETIKKPEPSFLPLLLPPLSLSVMRTMNETSLIDHTNATTSTTISAKSSINGTFEDGALTSSLSTTTNNMSFQDQRWYRRFKELLEFRDRNGHCMVPYLFEENLALGEWVKRQRYLYKSQKKSNKSKPNSLSDERIKLLNDIGFVWDSHECAWNDRFFELCDFMNQNHHFDIPSSSSNPKLQQLANWARRQRSQIQSYLEGKRMNKRDLDRIAKLNSIGFN